MIPWERFAVAMAHPVPVAIMRMLEVEPELSPKDMAQRLDLPLGSVSYHVRKLHDEQLIKQVRVEPRRGALEHYYSLPGRRNGKVRK